MLHSDEYSFTTYDTSFSRNSSIDDDPSIASLVEKNRHLQSEIRMISDLLCKKQEEIKKLKQATASSPLSELKKTIKLRDTNVTTYTSPWKFQIFLEILKSLKQFSYSAIIDDDVIREFVNYLKRNYPQTLIIDLEATKSLSTGTEEDIRKKLNPEVIGIFSEILLLLKSSQRYSLLTYNANNLSFYHYCLNDEDNEELAEQLVLRLRHYVDVEQLLHVSNPRPTPYTESALFTIENMVKIIWNALDNRIKRTVCLDELQKLPSHPDELNVTVTNNFIISKFTRMSELATSDKARGDKLK